MIFIFLYLNLLDLFLKKATKKVKEVFSNAYSHFKAQK